MYFPPHFPPEVRGEVRVDIGNLIDSNYRIHFQHLVPPLQRGWMNWLSKMVELKPQERYNSAASALAAIEPLDVNRLPKVRLSRDRLEVIAVVGAAFMRDFAIFSTATGAVYFIISQVFFNKMNVASIFAFTIAVSAVIFLTAYLFNFLVGAGVQANIKRGFPEIDAVAIALLTSGLSISSIAVFVCISSLISGQSIVTPLKIVLHAGLAMRKPPQGFALVAGIGLPLANLMGFKKARLLAKYRRAYPHLIKP